MRRPAGLGPGRHGGHRIGLPATDRAPQEIEPHLLEIAREPADQQPLPRIATGSSATAVACAQSSPAVSPRSTKAAVRSARSTPMSRASLASPTAPSMSNSVGDHRCLALGRAPAAISSPRSSRRLRPRPRRRAAPARPAKAGRRRGFQLGDQLREGQAPRRPRAAGRPCAGAAPRRRGRTAGCAPRSGIDAVSIASPDRGHAEQPLGRDEGRRELAPGSRLPPRPARRDGSRPRRLIMPVGELGGDDFAPQPVRERYRPGTCCRIAAGKAASSPRPRAAGRPAGPLASSASCIASLVLDSSTASSGRVRPWPSAARRASVCVVGQAFGARGRAGRAPPAFRSTRIWAGIAAGPAASAIDRASACSRLSSSTSAATSSVISPSSLTRACSVSRPARLAEASAILMLTSLSEQSTPAELSMKSVLIARRRRSANSMRPAWVQPRLAPSPITLARTSPPSTRSASLAGSPTCGVVLGRGLHIGADAAEPEQVDRAREDRRDQRVGIGARRPSMPSAARASGLSGISFWLRGKTPPPLEISALS